MTCQRLKKNKIAILGLAMITFLLFLAVFAPWIAPHDPIEPNLGKRFLSPCKEYPMGTDDLGRCVLSRVIYGTRVSLQVSMAVVG
ncbi:MAG: glutathione ABC transporter permease GsiD, partial [Methanosarcina sp.]|nr:glutathione ABC transporter permease GsiD [Methanosarcina sp.]